MTTSNMINAYFSVQHKKCYARRFWCSKQKYTVESSSWKTEL